MADALTTKTQVDPTIEEIVSLQVQEVLTANMVVPGSIMDFSAQVGPGMDALKIPKFGHFTVQDKVAGTAVSAQINAFSTDDLLLNKHKVVQFLVEDLASLQAKIGVIQAYINQAAKDLAAQMDLDLITAMVASPSVAAPDHVLQFANTPTDTLGKADILAARALLNLQNVPMSDRFMLISPDREKELLSIAEFVRVDESGASNALRNGEIGKLFGFAVLMSAQVGDEETLCYHNTSMAFARQMALRTQREYELAYLSERWGMDQLYGYKALDGGKRIVKIDSTG